MQQTGRNVSADHFGEAKLYIYAFEACLAEGMRDECPVPNKDDLAKIANYLEPLERKAQRKTAQHAREKAELGCQKGIAKDCISAARRVPQYGNRAAASKQAFQLAERACSLDARECTEIAGYLASGHHVKKDRVSAAAHYRLAAEAWSEIEPLRVKGLKVLASELDPRPEGVECDQGNIQSCELVVKSVRRSRFNEALFEVGRQAAEKLKTLCQAGATEACILPEQKCERGDLIGCSHLRGAPEWMTPNARWRTRNIMEQHCAAEGPQSPFCRPDELFPEDRNQR